MTTLALASGLNNQLTSSVDTLSDYMWMAIIPFAICFILKLFKDHASADEHTPGDKETPKSSVLEQFPVDQSVKDDTVTVMVSENDTVTPVENVSPGIDLNKKLN